MVEPKVTGGPADDRASDRTAASRVAVRPAKIRVFERSVAGGITPLGDRGSRDQVVIAHQGRGCGAEMLQGWDRSTSLASDPTSVLNSSCGLSRAAARLRVRRHPPLTA
jgi:hypothetical protein